LYIETPECIPRTSLLKLLNLAANNSMLIAARRKVLIRGPKGSCADVEMDARKQTRRELLCVLLRARHAVMYRHKFLMTSHSAPELPFDKPAAARFSLARSHTHTHMYTFNRLTICKYTPGTTLALAENDN
jgi:hypothetical protein